MSTFANRTNARNDSTTRVISGTASRVSVARQPAHREMDRAWSLIVGLAGYAGALAVGMTMLTVLAAVAH